MFMRVTTPEEIKAACDQLGFPLIVKPSSGASSEGVYKCESLEDTQDKYAYVYDRSMHAAILLQLSCSVLREQLSARCA